MTRRSQQKRNQQGHRAGTSSSRQTKAVEAPEVIHAEQVKLVQGPQLLNHSPQVAAVQVDANMQEKYLGTGLAAGFGPFLQVLSNSSANELVCKFGYRIFRQMLQDPEVDASIDALIQAACAQALTVANPVTKDHPQWELAEEMKDFVTEVLEELPIDDWRKEQLRGTLSYGNACSEIDWDIRGDKLVISGLRMQRPDDYGFLVDQWGKVYGVVPLNQASGQIYPLGSIVPLQTTKVTELKGVVPRYKLCLWSWEQKAQDPRGTSMLIPAYIPWWSKQRTLEEWSCWLTRYAQPSIWATPGPNAIVTCDANGKPIQPTELLLQALMAFRSGSALALPFGSQVELLEAVGSIEPFIKSLEFFNKEITRALLGQHLATSEGDNQSRQAAEIHALILRQLVGTIRQFMTRQINQEIVKPLIQANYGFGIKKLMPQISLGDSDGFPPTVTEIAVLFQAGYFSSDQLASLDKILGLPIRQSLDRVGAGNLPPYVDPHTGFPVSKDQPGAGKRGTDNQGVGEENKSKDAGSKADDQGTS